MPSPYIIPQTGHGSSIYALALSPDERLLASGGMDAIVRIWDVNTGNVLHQLHHHAQAVRNVRFSPSGDRLISASNDSIATWNVSNATLMQVFHGFPSAGLSGIAVSPDLRFCAVSPMQNEDSLNGINYDPYYEGPFSYGTYVWEIETGKLHHRLVEHTKEINDATFSSDGLRLATIANDKICLWCLESGQLIRDFKTLSAAPHGELSLSSDGQLLAAAYDDKHIRVHAIDTGEVIVTLPAKKGSVSALDFHRITPDAGKKSNTEEILTSAHSAEWAQWSKSSWTQIAGCAPMERDSDGRVRGHGYGIQSVLSTSAGMKQITCANDPKIIIWNRPFSDDVVTLPRLDGKKRDRRIACFAISQDGSTLVAGSSDYYTRVWDIDSGRVRASFRQGTQFATTVKFSPDGALFAVVIDGAGISVYRTHDLKVAGLYRPGSTKHLAFSFDNRFLASASSDRFRTVDLGSGEIKPDVLLRSLRVDDIAFSEDGSQIVTDHFHESLPDCFCRFEATSGSRTFWNVTTGEQLDWQRCSFTSAFPVGGPYATRNVGNEILLSDATNRAVLARFIGLPDGEAVAIAADGSFVATSGAYSYLRFDNSSADHCSEAMKALDRTDGNGLQVAERCDDLTLAWRAANDPSLIKAHSPWPIPEEDVP